MACGSPGWGKPFKYFVDVPSNAMGYSAVRLAAADFTALMDSTCHCRAGKEQDADVVFRIESPPKGWDTVTTAFAKGRKFPYFKLPPADFRWVQAAQADGMELRLTGSSPQGIANGLYALLQERLGFKFVHARQTVVPKLAQWPLAGNWEWLGNPRFDKRGFHLHTMHPLELTEALHDPSMPGALKMVQEYILWLARNGQNYFEFSLMEDVDDDLPGWVRHASQFTQYAHDRGILCGLDLSIHMVQQKSYQLVKFKPTDMRPFDRQVKERLRTLMGAKWDFINLEFALAEFVGGLEGLRNRLRDIVIAEMDKYPGTKLIGRQHVVKPEDEMGGSHGAESLNIPNDPRMGVLVHTVMCYALTDSRAPVYELKDFSHLLNLLRVQNQVRETWFYPESAYWVTFDNSIPLLLLPYLDARYRDIQTCAEMGVPGHVTFSSGWEWGYWLVDWSIARWCWEYRFQGETDGLRQNAPGPYQYLAEVFPDPAMLRVAANVADIERDWLIRADLLCWLCPSNPTDELPAPMNKQFQPRGFVNLGDLRMAAEKYPWRLGELPIDSLQHFATQVMTKAVTLQISTNDYQWGSGLRMQLAMEIIDAMRVTALRAQHSARLMEAAIEYEQSGHSMGALKIALARAAQTRTKALELVRKQEARYRYPLELLSGAYHSHTSYNFGYLHAVHNLHFWEREERQMLKRRHGPFFMSDYDLLRIAGMKD
ncbi:MAG: hypothetical protein U0176_17845 [Bacteroidia bacterium]